MHNPLLEGPPLPRIDFAHEAIPALVSVIIPAWKAAPHIAATLRTLGRQAYAAWELIVVEDGSADTTRQIVADFAADFPRHRVCYLRHDRSLGPAAARNTGFAEARGQFVALLDADDHWLPEHLVESVGRLEHDRSDIAYSTAIMVDCGSGIPFGAWGPTTADLASFPRNLFGRNFILPSATVLRRQVLEDVGGWHPGLRYAEDAFYWLACVRAGKTFSYLPGIRCIYTKNRDGAATQRLAETTTSFAWVVESFLAHPSSRPLPMSDHEAALRIAAMYHAAARHHLNGKQHGDPSADPWRAYQCSLRAWLAKPLRFRYLRLVIRAAVRSALAGRSDRLQPAGSPESAAERGGEAA